MQQEDDFRMLAADRDLTPKEAGDVWRRARKDHAEMEVESGLTAIMAKIEEEPGKKERTRFRQNSRRHRHRSGHAKVRFQAVQAKRFCGRK